MSTNDTLLDQCRREAEEKYPPDMQHWEHGNTMIRSVMQHKRVDAYAAALYAVASGRITKIGDCFVSSHRDDPTP